MIILRNKLFAKYVNPNPQFFKKTGTRLAKKKQKFDSQIKGLLRDSKQGDEMTLRMTTHYRREPDKVAALAGGGTEVVSGGTKKYYTQEVASTGRKEYVPTSGNQAAAQIKNRINKEKELGDFFIDPDHSMDTYITKQLKKGGTKGRKRVKSGQEYLKELQGKGLNSLQQKHLDGVRQVRGEYNRAFNPQKTKDQVIHGQNQIKKRSTN